MQAAPAVDPMLPPQIDFDTSAADAQLAREALPSAGIVKDLKLTPQERFLYQHHVDNITGQNGGKSVKGADGKTSTIYSFNVRDGGRIYVIPKVWDGKILSGEEARKRAGPLNQWPSYASTAEADKRYGAMHDIMEKDIPSDIDEELKRAKSPLDRALAPVPADPKKLPAYFSGASDADLATIGAGADVAPEIKAAVQAEQQRRRGADALNPDDMVDAPPDQTAAVTGSNGPEIVMKRGIQAASTDQLRALANANDPKIRNLARDELYRRSNAAGV